MQITETHIKDLFIVKPNVFGDERGYFYESFNQQRFNELVGKEITFVQDNQSQSQKNVLRGIHFQNPPFAQGKLVRVVKGSVLDVAVDLRIDSPTYGENFTIKLDDKHHEMLWIPEGFGHGFVSLEDDTIFSYKCTNYYNKESEGCILWNDPTININWNVENPILSEKDKEGVPFETFSSQFQIMI